MPTLSVALNVNVKFSPNLTDAFSTTPLPATIIGRSVSGVGAFYGTKSEANPFG